MNFSDLLERIQNAFKSAWDKIQDSPAYSQSKDRFDSLSPNAQKGTIVAAIALFGYLLFSIPYSYYSASADSVASFESQRQLLRDMLKVYREASDMPDIPLPPPAESVKAQIEDRLNRATLTPEQKLGIDISQESSDLIKANMLNAVVKVSLAKLNLQQIMDLGKDLQMLNPSVKLKDLIMQTNTSDARYFDVTYKLAILAVSRPQLDMTPDETPSKNKSKKPKKSSEDNE